MSAAATAVAATALVHSCSNKDVCVEQHSTEQQQQQQHRQQPVPGYELCAGGFEVPHGAVHPWHAPAVPSHEAILQAPTCPVVVTANPMVQTQLLDGSGDPQHHIPVNQGPMRMSSEFFEGFMEIHLAGLPNTQAPVFAGKKRFFHIMCQGRFRRPIAAAGLCMGQEFVKPGNAPPWIGELVFTAAAKVFSSSTLVDAYAEMPYFMNPLLASCQLVNVCPPGSEPPMAEAQEDMRLFSPALADRRGQPLCAARRRRWCDTPKHLDGLFLDTDNVWTFHMYQHVIDFSTYRLSLGHFGGIDIAGVLNGQPLQLTCYDTTEKQYLFSMLVWHEKLLYPHPSSAAADAETHRRVTALAERWRQACSSVRHLLRQRE